MNDERQVLDRLFAGQRQLPTLPVLFYEFCKLIENPQASHKQMADLIRRDPAMVAKVLHLCNSAIYCNVREIDNLSSAVIFLGMDTLKKLILQISLVRLFAVEEFRIPAFGVSVFWEHSLAAAHFADRLAERFGLERNEHHYLGGLMHDIGKLALFQAHPGAFADCVRLQIEEGMADVDAERQVLGTDHAGIGAYLAEKWKFKPELIEAIGGHHRPPAEGSGSLPALVRAANLFAKAAGLTFPWETRALDIVGDGAWRGLVAERKEEIDVERITFDLLDMAGEVRRAVQLMLGQGGPA